MTSPITKEKQQTKLSRVPERGHWRNRWRTMKPVRIQLSRSKGFNLQARSKAANGLDCVKVDRTTVYGNPFVVGEDGIDTIDECLDAYRAWICVDTGVPNGAGRPLAVQAREVLRGKNLACWCKPGDPCHADILLELSNA